MIYLNDYESSLGSILLAGDEKGLTGLWFTEGSRYIGLGLKKGACRREVRRCIFSMPMAWQTAHTQSPECAPFAVSAVFHF